MEARWQNQTIASSDDIVMLEGNAYFPQASLKPEFFRPSSYRSTCGWKGEAHYFDVVVAGAENPNAAWTYPEPKQPANAIAGRVAFWKGVQVA